MQEICNKRENFMSKLCSLFVMSQRVSIKLVAMIVTLALFVASCSTGTPPSEISGTAPSSLKPNLAPVPTSARYYVATNGSDSASGSKTSPFKTLAKAAGLVKPGDTVFIRGGTYMLSTSQKLTRSGTSGARITFMAHPGEKVVFDFSKNSMRTGGIHLVNADWNVVRNITIRYSPQQGIWMDGADHSQIVNMVLENNCGSGLTVYKGSYNIIAYSISRDNGMRTGSGQCSVNNNNAGNADGFGVGGNGGFSTNNEML
jgi:hypothetical protein